VILPSAGVHSRSTTRTSRQTSVWRGVGNGPIIPISTKLRLCCLDLVHYLPTVPRTGWIFSTRRVQKPWSGLLRAIRLARIGARPQTGVDEASFSPFGIDYYKPELTFTARALNAEMGYALDARLTSLTNIGAHEIAC
jgi:hypothetical protein